MMQTIFPHVFSAVDYNAISQVIHSLTEQSLCHVPNVTVCRFEVAGFFFFPLILVLGFLKLSITIEYQVHKVPFIKTMTDGWLWKAFAVHAELC